ncbi:hypothetical protein SAMD00019534_091080 [Acytostelium subglobosum LB1]|uniref:hypothetical protein n=1 Tax=Acytostelium subglobosum LB1 TaxID=1410327 RepID=UPI000644E744|nr:hypothetical protein SAMD00019534_091080 [Acytostelium subglobosum LB1]GAM25933.1 hypothetical protein SAMD00019534_091080 [Acytostelium subglobosum LB1]|eukprot:XP_012750976.1 hypothetical protein SAMD00019534_091080 [Acytostelium subglobosum LB1]
MRKKELLVDDDDDEDDDNDDVHERKVSVSNISTVLNNNNSSNSSNSGGVDDGPEYDSEEEKEFLINERREYQKRMRQQQLEGHQMNDHVLPIHKPKPTTSTIKKKLRALHDNDDDDDDIDDDDVNEDGPLLQSTTSSSSTSTTTTTTTTSTTSTSSTSTTMPTTTTSSNVQSSNSEQVVHIDVGDTTDNEIGREAQNILFIQNELSRPISFYGFLRRLLFAGILYLLPVSIVLFVALVTDWKHACDHPLKQWSSVQIVIQSLIIVNFIFLFVNLPSQDDNGNPPPSLLRKQFIFNTVHRMLSCFYITWFLVGIIWTFKARSSDKCPSSSPYLFWVTYSVIITQIILASGAIMFCCCSCMFSLMRLGAGVEMAPPESRGATDAMIRKLTIKKFHTGLLEKDDCSCAICLCEYDEDDKIRILPCRHHFHLDCVDRWLVINKSCPFCKRDIDHEKDGGGAVTSSTTTTSAAPVIHVSEHEDDSDDERPQQPPPQQQQPPVVQQDELSIAQRINIV